MLACARLHYSLPISQLLSWVSLYSFALPAPPQCSSFPHHASSYAAFLRQCLLAPLCIRTSSFSLFLRHLTSSLLRQFKNCSDKFVHTFCIPFCKSHVLDDLRVNMNDQPYHFRHFKLPTEPSIRRCGRGRLALLKQCKSYKGVNYVEEAADMAAATRNLPAQEYFANAMGHRFCLAAPGDFVSTPKITEYVAMGAAGGCLPLMVLAGDPWKTLP